MSVIQTYTGIAFDLAEPRPDMFSIIDIAHALSNICRFTGHTRHFYSVAHHSLIASHMVRKPHYQLEGLMHDAAEAYYGDMSTPLKKTLAGFGHDPYAELVEKAERAMADRFGLRYPWPLEVHEADGLLLAVERRDVMNPSVDVEWRAGAMRALDSVHVVKTSRKEIERGFLERFHLLRTIRQEEIVIARIATEQSMAVH